MKKQAFLNAINNPTLASAVIKQLGGWADFKEKANDIAEHGCSGGVSGVIYYNETLSFYDNNKKSILKQASDQANEFGVTTSDMIAGFNNMDLLPFEIESFLFGVDDENETKLKNTLTWYAVEEISRLYVDLN